jgi:hypothetical protein
MPRFLLALLLLATHAAVTQTPASLPDTPTGRWVAQHTSTGGIGSWWDFRPDGTLTMYIGAAVTAPVTHTADTLTVPGSGGNKLALDYKITGNILNLKRPGDPDTLFTRVGPAPKPSDPLLGRWRPNSPATYSPNPQLAARQKAMTTGVYIFSADNTQTVRIPFISRTGTWDAASHTLKLEGETQTFTFTRTAQGLTLAQPPDGKKSDTYLPDPVFPQ